MLQELLTKIILNLLKSNYLEGEHKNINLLLTYVEQMNIYDNIVKFMNIK